MTYQQTLHALADGTRRSILEQLKDGPRAVGEIAAPLPVSRPAVSQHLKVLKEAGLVRETRQGTRRIYRVDVRGLLALRQYLEGFWNDALTAFRDQAEATYDTRVDHGTILRQPGARENAADDSTSGTTNDHGDPT